MNKKVILSTVVAFLLAGVAISIFASPAPGAISDAQKISEAADQAPSVKAISHGDGTIVATMDAVLKTKIERFIRKGLTFRFSTTPKDLSDFVKSKLTPNETKLLGAGEPADVNASIENALRNMEEAGHIEFLPNENRGQGGWKLTEKGKGLDKKFTGEQ